MAPSSGLHFLPPAGAITTTSEHRNAGGGDGNVCNRRSAATDAAVGRPRRSAPHVHGHAGVTLWMCHAEEGGRRPATANAVAGGGGSAEEEGWLRESSPRADGHEGVSLQTSSGEGERTPTTRRDCGDQRPARTAKRGRRFGQASGRGERGPPSRRQNRGRRCGNCRPAPWRLMVAYSNTLNSQEWQKESPL